MKTKNLVIAIALMLSTQLMLAQKAEVNPEKSTITWKGKKIGGQHEGNIELKSGSIELKNDQIVAGTFVVDMTTITNNDLKDESYNQKLVGHLKSDDFFGVEKYPTAKFTVTNSTEFSDGTAKVTGKITIKENTEDISFDVQKTGNVYKTKLKIDRSKFDVRYGSNSFFDNLGDKAIDDIFMLNIKLVTQ